MTRCRAVAARHGRDLSELPVHKVVSAAKLDALVSTIVSTMEGALMSDVPVTTTDAGIPTASDAHSLTLGSDGPILLHDHVLLEQLAGVTRERVPERVVHAKGTGRSAASRSPTT